MKTNRSAVLYGPRDLRIEDRDVPSAEPGQVLVDIRAVGVCGSDVHYFEHGRIGDFVVDAPMVLGHESSGVVVDVGPGVSRQRIGERVALEPGVPCGVCEQCRAGRYNLCPDVRFFATPPFDGTFARRIAVDSAFAHPLPDNVSDEAGALVEPLSVAVWANRKAGTGVGDRVLVTGAGPIGVLCALVSQLSGASECLVTDINAERLTQASELGVRRVAKTDDRQAVAALQPNVLIECTGVEQVVDAGLSALAPAGRAVLVGMGATSHQRLPVALIQSRELQITGSFRYANTYPAAIAMASSGALQLEKLVGARVSLEHAEDALTMNRRDPTVLKTMVIVSQE